MQNLGELPELESVESEDTVLCPLMIKLVLLWSVVMLVAGLVFRETGWTLSPPAIGGIYLASALIILWALRRVGLTDSYWRTDTEGLRTIGLLRHEQIRWADVTSVGITRSISDLWRYYRLKAGRKTILIPTTDPYLEASIWQHLNRLGLADGIQLSKAAQQAWSNATAIPVAADPRYLHLRMLDSASGPKCPFERVLMLSCTLCPVLVVFGLALMFVGMSSVLRLVINIMVSLMGLAVLLTVFQLLRRWHQWEWHYQTSSRGYSLRIGVEEFFIPWSDVKSIDFKSDASPFEYGWEMTTAHRVVMVPTSDPSFAASVWQHLRLNGIIDDIEPPESLRIFWASIHDRAPEGTDWSCPEDLRRRWDVGWKYLASHYSPAIIYLAFVIGYAYRLSVLRHCSPLNAFNTGPIWLVYAAWLVLYAAGEHRHRLRLLANHARHIRLNTESLVAETASGEVECAWNRVRTVDWNDDGLRLSLPGRQEVYIVTDKDRKLYPRPLVLAVIDELRKAGNPCVLRMFTRPSLVSGKTIGKTA